MLCTIGVAYAAVRCLSVSLLVVKWWIWFIAHSDGVCLWQETDDQVPCISESCLWQEVATLHRWQQNRILLYAMVNLKPR